jgi:hypothetical protein
MKMPGAAFPATSIAGPIEGTGASGVTAHAGRVSRDIDRGPH